MRACWGTTSSQLGMDKPDIPGQTDTGERLDMPRKIRLSDHQIALLDEAVKIASDWWVTAAHQARAANMPAVEQYAVEQITAYEEMRSVPVERITVRVRDIYDMNDGEWDDSPEWTL